MKKINYFALAVTMLSMAACTSDENAVDTSSVGNLDYERIQIGVSNPASLVASKGTGAAGSTDDTTPNQWKGEKVNIYMLEKGTMKLAYFNEREKELNNPIYNGTVFITPLESEATNSGIASAEDGSIKYYPPTGTYDFWGYRLDDCELGALSKDDEQISVPFTLDGSQDIMVGKAELTGEQETYLKNLVESEEITRETKDGIIERMYSAYAARNGVQPNITFKHLLTRLTFQAQARTKDACDPDEGVRIEKVMIKSKYKGTLTLAYTDAVTTITNYKDQIQVDDDMKELYLKDKVKDADGNLTELTPVIPTWDDEHNKANKVDIGESIMIPAADEYELIFYLKQYKKTSTDGQLVPIPYEMPYTLHAPNSLSFEQGTSYNVLVTINGLEKIEITTTLEHWNDGGDININPEDENL